MSEREAFLRAIAANVYDDTSRLAFADWLDEHGEHDRAEFIRVQIELDPMRDKYEIPRAAELHAREDVLARRGGRGKFELSTIPGSTWDVTCEFRRGFPDIVCLNARRFIADGETIRRNAPTLRRLVVHSLNGWGGRLAACETLRGLPELELACWYADDDMKALAASPHLANLQTLVLWLGRLEEGATDAKLCQIAAKAKSWPELHELVLLDPAGESEKRIKRIVTSANRTAKRKIARYERGYPELFPLAPDFSYGCPGRLPDGRLVLAEAIRETGPNEDFCGWNLLTFDPDGTQRDETIRVPLSPDLLPKDWSARHKFEKQRKRVLTEQIGFVPAFIRVKGYDEGPHRGHYDNWDRCGYADEPDNPTDINGDPDANGIGGRIDHYVRNGEFVVGYDAWADKRGRVHST